VHSTSHTLPFENLKQIQTLAVSPDGSLLLSIDVDGRALLINRKRRALLHHFSFKGPVAAAKFSPDGRYLAVGVGRLVQVRAWPCATTCARHHGGDEGWGSLDRSHAAHGCSDTRTGAPVRCRRGSTPTGTQTGTRAAPRPAAPTRTAGVGYPEL
jgi:hypothetical protein